MAVCPILRPAQNVRRWNGSECEISARRRSGIDIRTARYRSRCRLRDVLQFVILEGMAKAISVRLDDEAERALNALEATGLTQSDAIRSSLLASAMRLRRGRELAAEAAALDADETDRAEMLEVASVMESLRAPR